MGGRDPKKPQSYPIESWVERQISDAMRRGEFDNLPGAGKPIPGIDDPPDPLWWVKQKMRRENLSYLPPSVALRRELEDALDAAAEAPSEEDVRAIVARINVKLEAALRTGIEGPTRNLMPLDVDRVLARWRDSRPE